MGEKTLREYSNESVAQLARMHLEVNGINARIMSDDCGGMRPELRAAAGVRLLVAEDDIKQAEECMRLYELNMEQESSDYEMGKPFGRLSIFLGGLVTGLLIGSVVLFFWYKHDIKYTGVMDGYFNSDKAVDATYTYENGVIVSSEEDWNFDGFPDAFFEYENGLPKKARIDTDFNGKIDVTYSYENGITKQGKWYPNESKTLLKVENFEHGLLTEEFIDKNGDGDWDQKIEYDSMGIVVNRTDR